jgi:hypothetical protein
MKVALLTIIALLLCSALVHAYVLVNTHTPGTALALSDGIAAFITLEDAINRDLNHDNDTADYVAQSYDTRTSTLTNTAHEAKHVSLSGKLLAIESKARVILVDDLLTDHIVDTRTRGTEPSASSADVVGWSTLSTARVGSDRIAFETSEQDTTTDLNGDGDTIDTIIRYYDVVAKNVTNTKAVGNKPRILNNRIVFSTEEYMVDTDLNGDGDQDDDVVRYLDFASNDVTNTKATGALVAGWRKTAILSDGKQFFTLDLDKGSTKPLGVFGNSPSYLNDMLVYERNSALLLYRVSTGVEHALKLVGKNPVIDLNAFAFIGENRTVMVIQGEDPDKDSIPDFADNCLNDSNADQADEDKDGIGDICEPQPAQVTNVTPVINQTPANASIPAVTGSATEPVFTTQAAILPAAAAPQVEEKPPTAAPRNPLPDTAVLQREKRGKNPAYWFLIAVGLGAIILLGHVIVSRFTNRRNRNYGF